MNCNKCGRIRHESEFQFRNKSKGIRHKVCRVCQREYWSTYRRKNYRKKTEAEKRRLSERRRQIRELIQKVKDVPCSDCGAKYPTYVMDFDHVNGEKHFTLALAVSRAYPLEKVREEIKKCDIVCANCHRIRTHGPGT